MSLLPHPPAGWLPHPLAGLLPLPPAAWQPHPLVRPLPHPLAGLLPHPPAAWQPPPLVSLLPQPAPMKYKVIIYHVQSRHTQLLPLDIRLKTVYKSKLIVKGN